MAVFKIRDTRGCGCDFLAVEKKSRSQGYTYGGASLFQMMKIEFPMLGFIYTVNPQAEADYPGYPLRSACIYPVVDWSRITREEMAERIGPCGLLRLVEHAESGHTLLVPVLKLPVISRIGMSRFMETGPIHYPSVQADYGFVLPFTKNLSLETFEIEVHEATGDLVQDLTGAFLNYDFVHPETHPQRVMIVYQVIPARWKVWLHMDAESLHTTLREDGAAVREVFHIFRTRGVSHPPMSVAYVMGDTKKYLEGQKVPFIRQDTASSYRDLNKFRSKEQESANAPSKGRALHVGLSRDTEVVLPQKFLTQAKFLKDKNNPPHHLMVIGLSSGLTPIPMGSYLFDSFARASNSGHAKYDERNPYPEMVTVNPWTIPDSRVVIHRLPDGFRFVFGIRALVHTGYCRSDVTKWPMLIAFGYHVPFELVARSGPQIFRGAGAELTEAIHTVPGLSMALTNALFDARLRIKKLDVDLNHCDFLREERSFPKGMMLCGAGWGLHELTRMEEHAKSKLQGHQNLSDYQILGGQNDCVMDGFWGMHLCKTSRRSYYKRAKPSLRFTDVVREAFWGLPTSLFAPEGQIVDESVMASSTQRVLSFEDD